VTAGVRFGAAFWIQRTDWPALRDACLAVEAAGWDSLWFDDHLLSDEADWGDAKLEGWASLAAMAVLTQRVRLGILISAITFRNPGLIAKLATTLDHLSGGRAVLGLGAGWLEREHDAFGFDFGSGFGERLDRLDETAGLIRRLLDGETVTYEGRWARMHDALCTPRPVQAHLPILIGGSGRTRTMRIVARHADIWNAYGTPASMAELSALLDERCAELGRAPDAIERTVTTHVVVRDTAEAAAAAWAPVARLHGLDERRGPDGTERGLTLGGSPAEVADLVARYREVGIGEVIFVFRSPFDLETIARLPDVRAAVET
jgi:alkanesulfonate monooxygenase SsuD/methylene tetrahydromethanopterin reductase-like flavin-dependent oxidoreductase (luciferase family)